MTAKTDTVEMLATQAHVKLAIRDLAVAMLESGLRYVDLTVGGGEVSITLRVFITKATNGSTSVKIGKKPR